MFRVMLRKEQTATLLEWGKHENSNFMYYLNTIAIQDLIDTIYIHMFSSERSYLIVEYYNEIIRS